MYIDDNMKAKLILSFLLLNIVFEGNSLRAQRIPELGIVATLEQDSLVYASGFKMLGESVGRMLSPALSKSQFANNLKRIQQAHSNVFLCNIFFPSRLKIAGPDVNEQHVLRYADSVFMRAKQAGVKLIVQGSGGARRLPDSYDIERAKTDFSAICRNLAFTAEKYGVMIALESLESSETNFLTTLASAAEIVRRVNHPNFKLNADIFHMMRESESPQSILDAGELLVYCEIAEKETRSLPGVKGDNFKPYLRALKAAKYSGPIFIEGNTKQPELDIPLSFIYLTRQLKEVYSEK